MTHRHQGPTDRYQPTRDVHQHSKHSRSPRTVSVCPYCRAVHTPPYTLCTHHATLMYPHAVHCDTLVTPSHARNLSWSSTSLTLETRPRSNDEATQRSRARPSTPRALMTRSRAV